MTSRLRLSRSNLSAICFALSAIALGHALQIKDGFYDPGAIAWLTGALALCIDGTLLQKRAVALSRVDSRVVVAILACGLAWQVQQLFTAKPAYYLDQNADLSVFKTGVAIQAACMLAGVMSIRVLRRLWFPGVLAASVWLGIWIIQATPKPYIDVRVVHKEAIEALVSRQDPYMITFENIYDEEYTKKFYNPSAVAGNRLAFAYPYPPMSLIPVVPGHVLLGDYRYAELAWLVAGAALIGFSRRGLVAQLAASLLLTTPRIWFVIEQGWTEPVAVFMLGLTVYLLIRRPIAAAFASGLFVATKQYLGFAGLAVIRLILLQPTQWRRVAIGVAAGAAVTIVPFLLWHPDAFMKNVVFLQTHEPFRIDSLSYLSWAALNGLGTGSFVWALGAGAAAAIVSVVGTRNTPDGFAASVAMTVFVFSAFGSKAFCNYYFFIISALCCALAVFPTTDSEPES